MLSAGSYDWHPKLRNFHPGNGSIENESRVSIQCMFRLRGQDRYDSTLNPVARYEYITDHLRKSPDLLLLCSVPSFIAGISVQAFARFA